MRRCVGFAGARRTTASDDQEMATPEHAMAGTPSRLGPLDGLGNAR